MNRSIALAVAAHPDDIEFMMSGTLLLLKEVGYETHYLNLASGSCGSMTMTKSRTRLVRAKEAKQAARILGAHFHPSLVDDLEVMYEPGLLRKVAAVVREVRPSIVLTHALDDYMEDHMNTARLAVAAAFARGMRNFRTAPNRKPYEGDVAVYHAMPHGLRCALGRKAVAGGFVDVTSVHPKQLETLGAHRSQKEWLDASQGMHSYLAKMEGISREVGKMSGRFRFAEGWCQHNPLGLGTAGANPLREKLGKRYRENPGYARWLDKNDF